MQDKNDNTDDAEFDDIDFDDVDEDFDESWDDFDDEDDASSDAADAPVSETGAAPAKTQDKTFLQKNFNLIVITIALIGGSGFVYTQFLSGPKPSAPPANSAMPIDTANQQNAPINNIPEGQEIAELSEGLPPMPAPIEGRLSDELELDLGNAEASSMDEMSPDLELDLSNDVLTPMPDINDEASIELSGLDLNLEEADVNSGQENLDDFFNTPSPVSDNTQNDLDAQLDLDAPLEIEQEPVIEHAEMSLEDIQASDPESPILDAPFVEDTMAKEPASESGVLVVDGSQQEKINELNKAIANKDSMLEAAVQTEIKLSSELSIANEKIGSLEVQIQQLTEKINSLESPAVSAPEEKEPAPVAGSETPATTTSSEVTSRPSAPKPQPNTYEWALRSAQPGNATLSPKGSNDLHRVEVGDTVAGLGRIQSIAQENGRWVVRGSKGTVSQ